MPQRLGYRINQVRVDIGIDQPESVKPERDRLAIDTGIETRRNDGAVIKREILFELVEQRVLERHQADRYRRGEVADRRDRIAPDQEERVDLGALQLLGRRTGPQKLAGQILLAEPGGALEDHSVPRGPRPGLTCREHVSPQIS